jgi:hypothetical protein
VDSFYSALPPMFRPPKCGEPEKSLDPPYFVGEVIRPNSDVGRRLSHPSVRAGDYAFPWPDRIEGLGPRRVEALDRCSMCGAGSWVCYGQTMLCLSCAKGLRQRDRLA